MTKLTLGSHPFLLGFDQLERLVERTAKSGNDGYPPFNIEQSGGNAFRITLAVAGFGEEDLSITVEDRQLVIRGKQADRKRAAAYRPGTRGARNRGANDQNQERMMR